MLHTVVIFALLFVAGAGTVPRSLAEGRVLLSVERYRPKAVVPARAGALVAWGGIERDGQRLRNVCYLSPAPALRGMPRPIEVRRHQLFATVSTLGTCCARRTAVAPTEGDGQLVVTSCSGRSGTWLWSQVVSGAGQPLDASAPVWPIPDRTQELPTLVAAREGGTWLTWVEREGTAAAGGVVRATRVDGSGKPVLEPVQVSDPALAAALGGPAPDSLHAELLPGGGIAIAWLARSADGTLQIRLRLLEPDGSPKTPEVGATPDDHAPRSSHRIHVLDDGSIAVVWARRDSGGDPGRVFLRRFSTTGEPTGNALPVAVDEPKRSQLFPRFVRSASATWVVWIEPVDARSGSGEASIAVRRWSFEAGPIGLTTRFPATLAEHSPFLEAIPGTTEDGFTLYWHTSPDGIAESGGLAWRQLTIPDPDSP